MGRKTLRFTPRIVPQRSFRPFYASKLERTKKEDFVLRKSAYQSPVTEVTRFLAYAAELFISVALAAVPAYAQLQDTQSSPTSTVTGSIADQDGAVIVNASVSLDQPGHPQRRTQSGKDGTFTFPGVFPASFDLTVEASGFAIKKISGDLQPGQLDQLSQIRLEVAANVEVAVAETQEQIAEEQIHVEEQQRVLAIFPNYYVSYEPKPAPLNTRQKYELAWKASINPYSFGIAAFLAGLEQAGNYYSGYGRGVQGYGKRLGATYADSVAGTFIGGAILPAVFKQDPRYYYKGVGTHKSRLLYALAASVRCKGDNGRWQPNYSNVLGDLAAGALSNAYYPASNRNGVGLTFENTLIGIAGSSFAGVVQEFFLHKLTPHHDQGPQN